MKRLSCGTALVLCAGLALAMPALAQETVAMPTVQGNTARVLVKRGEAYLRITEGVALQPTDSLVLLEGAAVDLKCGDATIASIRETGIYAIPPCPAPVAVAEAQAAPTTAGTTTAPAKTGGMSKALITTGVVVAAAGIAAAASGGGGDGGSEQPVSP